MFRSTAPGQNPWAKQNPWARCSGVQEQCARPKSVGQNPQTKIRGPKSVGQVSKSPASMDHACVPTHVYMRACACVCSFNACVRSCMCACVLACTRALARECLQACVHACVCACICACMRVCVCVRACVHVHVCVHHCFLLFTQKLWLPSLFPLIHAMGELLKS